MLQKDARNIHLARAITYSLLGKKGLENASPVRRRGCTHGRQDRRGGPGQCAVCRSPAFPNTRVRRATAPPSRTRAWLRVAGAIITTERCAHGWTWIARQRRRRRRAAAAQLLLRLHVARRRRKRREEHLSVSQSVSRPLPCRRTTTCRAQGWSQPPPPPPPQWQGRDASPFWILIQDGEDLM